MHTKFQANPKRLDDLNSDLISAQSDFWFLDIFHQLSYTSPFEPNLTPTCLNTLTRQICIQKLLTWGYLVNFSTQVTVNLISSHYNVTMLISEFSSNIALLHSSKDGCLYLWHYFSHEATRTIILIQFTLSKMSWYSNMESCSHPSNLLNFPYSMNVRYVALSIQIHL